MYVRGSRPPGDRAGRFGEILGRETDPGGWRQLHFGRGLPQEGVLQEPERLYEGSQEVEVEQLDISTQERPIPPLFSPSPHSVPADTEGSSVGRQRREVSRCHRDVESTLPLREGGR